MASRPSRAKMCNWLSEGAPTEAQIEAAAKAWDEGLSAAIDAEIQDGGYGNTQYPDNPYRAGALGEAAV